VKNQIPETGRGDLAENHWSKGRDRFEIAVVYFRDPFRSSSEKLCTAFLRQFFESKSDALKFVFHSNPSLTSFIPHVTMHRGFMTEICSSTEDSVRWMSHCINDSDSDSDSVRWMSHCINDSDLDSDSVRWMSHCINDSDSDSDSGKWRSHCMKCFDSNEECRAQPGDQAGRTLSAPRRRLRRFSIKPSVNLGQFRIHAFLGVK
jgi:hypothetical protein